MKKFLALTLILIMLFPLCSVGAEDLSPKITLNEFGENIFYDLAIFADKSGAIDSTNEIQNAINNCYNAGGGTVYLPAGKYRVTGNIEIKSSVTLRGDYGDPDVSSNYGTVILADVPSSEEGLPLFTLSAESCARGLTVFYPNQDINNVKPYPYTFFLGVGMLFSVYDCTFLNSYKGFGSKLHEMFTVDNIKGTFLKEGFNINNQSDVGTFKNIKILGKYWANAGSYYNAPNIDVLNAYTRQNTSGMIFSDLEWAEYFNIEMSDVYTGVHTVKGERVDFCGEFYDLNISNATRGFFAEVCDNRWGILVANSFIQGSEFALKHNTEGSSFKCAGTVFDGIVKSWNRHYLFRKTETMPEVNIDYNKKFVEPLNNIYSVTADRSGQTDVSELIQEKLDQAKETGGIVYLPSGYYRLEKPIYVPKGVQLRGSGSGPVRGSCNGTFIFAAYGKGLDPFSTDALINLNEDNSGLYALQIIYTENYPRKTENDFEYDSYNFAIKITATNNYLENVSSAAACNFVFAKNATNFIIKKAITCSYDRTYYFENCTDGQIEECLQNGTVGSRIGGGAATASGTILQWIALGNNEFSFNDKTHKTLTHITLINTTKQKVLNTFTYGSQYFFLSDGSDSLSINTGADGGKGSYMVTSKNNSNTMLINMMRHTANRDRTSFSEDKTGRLQIFNRLTAYSVGENDIVNLYDEFILGDYTDDDMITIKDAMMCFRYIAGKILKPSVVSFRACDFDKNEELTIEDAMKVFMTVAGKSIDDNI